MLRSLSFVFIFLFSGVLLFGQTTDYLPRLDNVWQIGSCNCYLFSISIWKTNTQGDKNQSKLLYNFHLISGKECEEFKEFSRDFSLKEIPQSLKELDVNYPFLLAEADHATLNQLSALENKLPTYTYLQEYRHISLTLNQWEENEKNKKEVFSIILSSLGTNKTEELPKTSDVVFFGLYEELEH